MWRSLTISSFYFSNFILFQGLFSLGKRKRKRQDREVKRGKKERVCVICVCKILNKKWKSTWKVCMCARVCMYVYVCVWVRKRKREVKLLIKLLRFYRISINGVEEKFLQISLNWKIFLPLSVLRKIFLHIV